MKLLLFEVRGVRWIFWLLLVLTLPGKNAFAQWQTHHPMPTARYAAAAVELNGWIYVIGGKNASGVLKTVERYDPKKDQWDASVADMREARANLAAVVFEGKIFVIGGESGDHTALDEAEFYDPVRNQWEKISDLNIERNGAAAVVYQNQLLVLGGSDEYGNYLNQVEVYDPSNDEWHYAPNMNLPLTKSSMEAVAYGPYLFAIGGFYHGPLATIDRYSPATGWQTVGALAYARGDFSVAFVDSSLYVVGGTGFTGTVPNIEVWSLAKMQKVNEILWVTPLQGVAATGYDSRLYLFGGKEKMSHLATNLVQSYTVVSTVVDESAGLLPSEYLMVQNYPNPMRTVTEFQIQLRNSALRGNQPVEIFIYDFLGREIWHKKIQNSGERMVVSWSGTDYSGRPVSSGIYYYRVRAGQLVSQNKLIVVR